MVRLRSLLLIWTHLAIGTLWTHLGTRRLLLETRWLHLLTIGSNHSRQGNSARRKVRLVLVLLVWVMVLLLCWIRYLWLLLLLCLGKRWLERFWLLLNRFRLLRLGCWLRLGYSCKQR